MHPVANHLIQLQEMILIRDEQKVHGVNDHLERLDNNITTMSTELKGDVKRDFDRLLKKDRIVIVPVADGVCAACGMRLPISLVQAVRIGRDTSHTLMIPRLESTDAEGAIRELAYKMEAEGFVDKADALVEEALRREALVSTAVAHGLAFPHVRGVEGGGLTLALGVNPKGIRFGDGAKNLTKIIFFMVIPTAASAFYLKLLAGLAETFMKADVRKAIVAEKDPEKLWKALTKVTRSTIK
jgi:mannitol/fructose-specific phosphotransferase system IIA component (Ntr-type)